MKGVESSSRTRRKVTSRKCIASMYTGKKHKALHGLLIGDLCLMIAATNSRTAVSIAAFELLLLAISIVFARTAEYARKMIAILCICLCGFRFNLINFKPPDMQIIPEVSAEESIQNSKKR